MDGNKPAFPFAIPRENLGWETGLTKREYFAAKAMQALLASGKFRVDDEMVSEAWTTADCMLNHPLASGD